LFEILEKIILAGVGLATMSKEKAEKLVDAMIQKGKIMAKDKKAAVSRILKSTKQLDKDLEKKMKEISQGVVEGSQKQIDSLNARLASLSKKLEKAKEKNKSASRKKKSKKK